MIKTYKLHEQRPSFMLGTRFRPVVWVSEAWWHKPLSIELTPMEMSYGPQKGYILRIGRVFIGWRTK